MPSPLCDLIVLRHGELFLKGDNRRWFEDLLLGHVRRALVRSLPEGRVERGQGRFFVLCPPPHVARVLDALARVFGVSSLSPAVAVPQEMAAIGEAAVALVGEVQSRERPASFRIRAHRSDKQFPLPSPEIGRQVGAQVVEAFGLRVDLVQPELTVGVEVGPVRSFVFAERLLGAGGLPVGSSGAVALLLSGGIDSPVAGHLMQKRGCTLFAIHFESPPYTGARTRAKVLELARKLAPAQGSLVVNLVRFTPIQTAIRDRAPCELAVVLYRRAMMRIASMLARQRGCLALATGESLGQVASQTLENLACIEETADLPVLRPLLTYDKAETVELARHIGTYDLSIAPYEDCCSLFVPRHPATRARAETLDRVEAGIDLRRLLEEAAAAVETVALEP
jgi:thiamine biosynthesis protein ThiI